MAASTALSGFIWSADDYIYYYYYFNVNCNISLALLASLSAIAFALVFFALQWSNTKVIFMKSSHCNFYIHELLEQLELLIPALVMAPILSVTSFIIFIYIWAIAIAAKAYISAHLTGLLYLLMAIISIYYWVGVKALYGKYHPSSPAAFTSSAPLPHPPNSTPYPGYLDAPPPYDSLNNV